MSTERHDRIGEIFLAACDVPLEERRAFVEARSNGDRSIADEVLAMLRRDVDTTDAFDGGVAALGDVAQEALSEYESVGIAELERDEPSAHGDRIGRYQLVRPLGEGGMGIVWEARQDRPARSVALKVLRFGGHPDLIRRFELEGEALGRLHHPAIASVFEAGVAEVGGTEQPFLALELVAGEPLDRYADSLDLDLEARVYLLLRVAEGVRHAHQRGVVHRDLKPGNVLVQDNGQPKILDFGIARVVEPGDDGAVSLLTRTGEIVGTLAYMAPEQVSGDPSSIDTRADVYALGVLAYELISGKRPIDVRGVSLTEGMRRVLEDTPTQLTTAAPQTPTDLATIVHKALEKDPARRYASVDALSTDLQRFLRHEPVEARPPSLSYQVSKFVRRHRGATIGAAAAALAIVAGGVTSAVMYLREQSARVDAVAAGQESAAALERSNASLAIARKRLHELRETQDFFQGLMSQVLPGEAGRDLRLSDALTRSASSIPTMFDGAPSMRAWLHDNVADMYVGLGMVKEAEEQLELARSCVTDMTPRLAAAIALTSADIHFEKGELGLAQQEIDRGLRLVDDSDRAMEAELIDGAGERSLAAIAGGDLRPTLLADPRAVAQAQRDVLTLRVSLHAQAAKIANEEHRAADALEHLAAAEAAAHEMGESGAEALARLAFVQARTYLTVGDPQKALAVTEEAVARAEERGLTETLAHSNMLTLQGAILVQLGRRADAAASAEASYEILQAVASPDHPYLARVAGNLATAKRGIGRLDEALAHYDEARAIEARVLEPGDPAAIQTRTLRGSLLVQMGQDDEGEAELLGAIEDYDALIDSTPSADLVIMRAFAKTYLAPLLRGRGEFDAADGFIMEAMDEKLSVLGSSVHPLLEAEVKELAQNARARGDQAQLAEREMDVTEFFAAVRGPGDRTTGVALRKAREAFEAAALDGATDDVLDPLRTRLEALEERLK
ncbi:MAG: serine/threonine-protein kinase [Planctomycetota bacterium]